MFKKIAVAFDKSPEAKRAFHSALELARLTGEAVTIITVVEDLPAYIQFCFGSCSGRAGTTERLRRELLMQTCIKRARSATEEAGIHLQSKLVEDREVEGLIHAIDKILPDLLVVGLRRDPGGLKGITGGTAHQMALRASCKVLGIR